MQVQISEEELKRFMKNKSSFHKALIKYGFYLEELKSRFNTVDLFKDILFGKCYFPLAADVKIKMCSHPPPAKELLEIIATLIETGNYNSLEQAKQFRRLAKHMRRHSPSTTWMLHLLGTINGEHEIFHPNFKPVMKPSGERI